jgi:HD-GYP domain-containing protein (c-di-GMP phosphodiesterase class II)
MIDLVLQHDVTTLTGEVLLPGGTRLDQQTCAELSRRRKNRSCRSHLFANLTDQVRDLREFLDKPPYGNIFSDRRETAEILSLMGQAQLIEPVIEALEYFREHDFHTYRHSLMVFALSTLLARYLYPDDRRSLRGALAGPSHDLGKICVPPKILQKQTPLTSREVSILKHHSVAGYVLLTYYTGDFDYISAMVARDHHERRDGSGYPRGIDTFDEMVEVVILADIYDALISPRPYRPVSFDNRSALDELTRMAQNRQIGWGALKALIAFNRSSRPDFRVCEVSMKRRGQPPVNNVYGKIAEDE